MSTKVIFAPSVDEAILNYLDYVEIDDIPPVLNFVNKAQERLAETLSVFPMGGRNFQKNTQFYPIKDSFIPLRGVYSSMNMMQKPTM